MNHRETAENMVRKWAHTASDWTELTGAIVAALIEAERHGREWDDAGWRVGRKVGRTIYLDGKLVGVMDTPELARQVVAALRGEKG